MLDEPPAEPIGAGGPIDVREPLLPVGFGGAIEELRPARGGTGVSAALVVAALPLSR